MCGFVGAFFFSGTSESYIESLKNGLNCIKHRGPDHSGFYQNENVFFGHNRLKIIDISNEADQPFESKNGNACIVFNGEIYNYAALKNDLKSKIQFRTNSDTEVLLEGYLAEGISFFKKLRGIYAFAIWDENKAELLLGRDASGLKPLYYFNVGNKFIFGSEIKAILPALKNHISINQKILKTYLAIGYCLEPETIYNEIKTVKPGTFLRINQSIFEEGHIWKFDFETENNYSFSQNVAETKKLLKQSVSRNLTADVEVSVALSGGIDSSLIYAYAKEQNAAVTAYNFSFKNKDYDETEITAAYAKQLGGQLNILQIEPNFLIDDLHEIFDAFDQPYANASAIPFYYLCKTASQHTKVLLGGEGGDELFNGYATNRLLPLIFSISGNPALKNIATLTLKSASIFSSKNVSRQLNKLIELINVPGYELLFQTILNAEKSAFKFPVEEAFSAFNAAFINEKPGSFEATLVFENFRKILLSDYLRKADLMAMQHGVEYRVPMLDEDLTQFAFSIAYNQKSSIKESKKILRKLHAEIYPKKYASAKKSGFRMPLDAYLTSDDINYIFNEVARNDSIVGEYVNAAYIAFLKNAYTHRNTSKISRDKLIQMVLTLYNLHRWHQKNY